MTILIYYSIFDEISTFPNIVYIINLCTSFATFQQFGYIPTFLAHIYIYNDRKFTLLPSIEQFKLYNSKFGQQFLSFLFFTLNLVPFSIRNSISK